MIAVAESDSYLKWAVSLLAQLPSSARVDIVLACSPLRPSSSQRIAALAGSGYAGYVPEVLSPAQLRHRVERDRPDVVLLACTGPSAHAYQEALASASHRPVLLAGVPGIALPARPRAWAYRGAIDLFVVHSRREVEQYDRLRVLAGKSGRLGLATLPFLPPPSSQVPLSNRVPLNNRVLFATQAIVPQSRRERVAILLALDQLAANRPDLRVVVKTRGRPGEFHTHHEAHHYADLWRHLVASGQVRDREAVGFVTGSMAEQLRDAAALVTVSSTAVLEAIALDLPVLLIDEFGVNEALLNEVFADSAALAGLEALRRGDFRRPDPGWRDDNYFHPAKDNTWIETLGELVVMAHDHRLPPIVEGLDQGRSARRRQIDRLRLTPAGTALVRGRQRLKKQLLRNSQGLPRSVRHDPLGR